MTGHHHTGDPHPMTTEAHFPDGYLYRLTFESVSAITHPELYRGDHPRYPVAEIDDFDDYWHTTTTPTRTPQEAATQYAGLLDLAEAGEYIRNITVTRRPDDDVFEPFDPTTAETKTNALLGPIAAAIADDARRHRRGGFRP